MTHEEARLVAVAKVLERHGIHSPAIAYDIMQAEDRVPFDPGDPLGLRRAGEPQAPQWVRDFFRAERARVAKVRASAP